MPLDTHTISALTMRRFILGKQGLWPGRRWRGKGGALQAAREMEAVQLDPLNVVARSHDLALHSRVLDYEPEHLHSLAYKDRQFFDYGGTLFFYPMEELPYWRLYMRHRRQEDRIAKFLAEHKETIGFVKEELRNRGPLGNRDFTGNRVNNYRGRKDTAVALFCLWLIGDIMTSTRNRFERVYDFRENVAPPEFQHEAAKIDADRHFARKAVAQHGLLPVSRIGSSVGTWSERPLHADRSKELLAEMLDDGTLARVRVEGLKTEYLCLFEDLVILDELESGRILESWIPLETTNDEEVLFLAPLEMVSARGRAKKLFGFEYVWEVYKPAHLRKWGYYNLPVLYQDRLVARIDPRLDRKTKTLVINGIWIDHDEDARNPALLDAFAAGLARLAHFHGTDRIDASAVNPARLRTLLERRKNS